MNMKQPTEVSASHIGQLCACYLRFRFQASANTLINADKDLADRSIKIAFEWEANCERRPYIRQTTKSEPSNCKSFSENFKVKNDKI